MQKKSIYYHVLLGLLGWNSWSAAQDYKQFVFSVNSGYSWSTKANICANPSFWDPAPEGYNARVGNSAFYSAGIGYQPWCFPLLLMFSAVTRPSYKYCKFQSSLTVSGDIGSKTRFFNVSNNVFLFAVFINKINPWWCWHVGCNSSIAPFIGGGVGVAYNSVDNVHTVLPTQQPGGFNDVLSIMNKNTKSSIAAQAEIGLAIACNESVVFDIGYRFFYGGQFATNNYVVNIPGGFTRPSLAPAWSGRLMANELNVGFSVQF
ncbi:hypothetical protein M1466_01220 [Candidatus Dependentiae bacterium]|nr:hypothetical protein [Candidatus Dependentiae bacterium]